MMKNFIGISIFATLGILGTLMLNSAEAYNRENRFYTHLNVGYGLQDIPQTLSDSTKKYSASAYNASLKSDGKGYVGTGGIGFHLLNEFRIDFSFYYNAGLKSKKNITLSDATINSKSKVDSTGVFISAFYDIMTGSVVNPYLMLGLGVMKSQYKPRLTIIGNRGTTTLGGTKSLSGLAYKFGLGGSYHYASNFDIDVGYHLIHQGPVKSSKNNKRKNYEVTYGPGLSATGKREMTHVITAGFRYTF